MRTAQRAAAEDSEPAIGSKHHGVVHARSPWGFIVLVGSRRCLWHRDSIEAAGLDPGTIALGRQGQFRVVWTDPRRQMKRVDLVRWMRAPAPSHSPRPAPAVPCLSVVRTRAQAPAAEPPAKASAAATTTPARRQRKGTDSVISGAIVAENLRYASEFRHVLEEGAGAMNEIGQRYRRNTGPSRAGMVNEGDHVATFVVDGVAQREPVWAHRYDSRAKNSPDVGFGRKGHGKSSFASLKNRKTPKDTARAQRGYGDQLRVCSEEQAHAVRRHAARREAVERAKGPRRAGVRQEWSEVRELTTDRLKDGPVESQPRTLKETRQLGEKARQGQVQPKDIAGEVGQRAWDGAKSGFKAGARTGAAISTVLECARAFKGLQEGDRSLPDIVVSAAANVAIDTAASAVKGMAAGAAEGAAQVLATRAGSRVAAGVLRSGVAGTAAIALVDVAASTFRLARGDIDETQYKAELKETAGCGLLSFLGGLVGSLLGPAGTLVGSIGLPLLVRKLVHG